MNLQLFRIFGITVYLHWSWFLIAAYQIQYRATDYPNLFWPLAEYVALFGIVLLHEFGHSLACRQTGGQTGNIVLWPLGGVAYVNPPPRPGAQLWSIAAGPLVNVALAVLMILGAFLLGKHFSLLPAEVQMFLERLWLINLVLLIFNLLPIYPLDGGQILRSLLWFVIGPVRSLKVAVIIGILGGLALIGLAILAREIWLGIIALFILMQCARSFAMVRQL